MVPLNIFIDEGFVIAQILGCQISQLPITYLCVPLHYKNLTKDQYNFLLEEIKKKLQG
jgi:hypothetical protein